MVRVRGTIHLGRWRSAGDPLTVCADALIFGLLIGTLLVRVLWY